MSPWVAFRRQKADSEIAIRLATWLVLPAIATEQIWIYFGNVQSSEWIICCNLATVYISELLGVKFPSQKFSDSP